MANVKNIRMGPCRIFWGGVDLGYTQGGVNLQVSSTTVDITSDEFGQNPMDKRMLSRTVSVKVPLVETIPGKLDMMINGGDGSATSASVKAVSSVSVRKSAQTLVLHPLSKASTDTSEDFCIVLAYPFPDMQVTYNDNNERIFNVTFSSYPYFSDYGSIPGLDTGGVFYYGSRDNVVTSAGISRVDPRSTPATYIDEDFVLRTAKPYQRRPNYVLQDDGSNVQKGFMSEGQISTVAATNGWWKSNVFQEISNITTSQTSMVLPDSTTGLVDTFEITDPTQDANIPIGNVLNREATNPTGYPVWSFFIQVSGPITPTTVFKLGVSGQSQNNFLPFSMNWDDETLAAMKADPTFAWHLYIPRQSFYGGWMRFPLGGRTIGAGAVNVSAQLQIPANTFTAAENMALSIYIWGVNSTQYEAGDNYCSSFVYGNSNSTSVTRASD